MRLGLSLLVLVAALVPADAQNASRQAPSLSRRTVDPVVPGQVLVRTLPGVDVDALMAETGLALVGEVAGTDTYLVSVPEGSEPACAQLLGALPGTQWSETNRRLFQPESPACGTAPVPTTHQCTIAIFDGDPAPERFYDQPTMPIINAAAAQELSTGMPSIVAVIDTGIDPTHPVFDGRLAGPGYDFLLDQPVAYDLPNGIDDDGDGLVDEAVGHGTHVSGIVALINPSALVLPLRVLDSEGNGTAFDVARAIHYAIDAGADVLNLSLGMTGYSQVVDDALARAADLELPVFAAAGNTATEHVLYPARRESVVAVAALDVADIKADFSAYGSAVEFCAPGVDIYSAMPGGAWAWWSGTSMATAVASGAASLLHSVGGPTYEMEGDDELEETCASVYAENPTLDDLLGEGRLDVEAAALHLLAESESGSD